MIFEYLRKRADSEHEQDVIRVGFAVIILAHLLRAVPTGTVPPVAERLCLLISVGYLIGSLALLAHVLLVPAVRPRRRYAGMLLDLVTLPIGMIVGGALVAWLYPMFIWVTVGMGFRYGARYLVVAAGLSVTGFAVVIAASPFWRGQPALSIGLLLALVVLPAFAWKLRNKLIEAMRRIDETRRPGGRLLATMRYGARYLFIAVAVSAAIFAVVPEPVIGPLLALIVLPAYGWMLLTKLIGTIWHAAPVEHIAEMESHRNAGSIIENDAPRPPEKAEKLLFFSLPREDIEAIAGDIEQHYKMRYYQFGDKYARQWYWKEAISTIIARNKALRWIAFGGLLKWASDWFSRFGS